MTKKQTMTDAEDIFHNIANKVHDVCEGKMFGAMCLKLITGKAVVIFWKDSMLFKLNEEDQKKSSEIRRR